MVLVFCFFIWLESEIFKVSRLFNPILWLWESLGFLFWRTSLAVSISSNLFSVSISEICSLCMLVSFFQGDLFGGVSGGLSVLSNFLWGGRLLGFVVLGGMPGVCRCLG